MSESLPALTPALWVVSTPIGNLDDITRRAVQVLEQASVIAAEDTRHTQRLLDEFGIRRPLLSYHDHNEEARAREIVARIQAGEAVALVSDAGTPLLSDPGYRVVRACQQAGVRVIPVPGASALLAALAVAGLPTDRFVFEGFLPAKGSTRQQMLTRLASASATTVFYEAPHRIESTLAELAEALTPEREVVLCRELTKHFETVLTGSAQLLLEKVRADANQQRGEMVLLIGPASEDTAALGEHLELAKLLLAELPASKAAKVLAAYSGKKRGEVYQWLETLER